MIVLQSLNHLPLFLFTATIVLSALVMDRRSLLRMVSRSRYLFLSMLILFLFMTPGVRLPGIPGTAGMSREGLATAAEHCVRLLAMLALVVVLIRRLGRLGLVTGLVALLQPLARFGLDARALAVRVALTLEEVATERHRSWRDYLEPVETEVAGSMHLEHRRWRKPDALLAIAVVIGLIAAAWLA